MGGPNRPFVVWASCFLWVISMFAISWSLTLFFCVGDMLFITGTDLVMAVVLLSGLIMLPTNLYMLYTIANGQRINHNSKVLCCPLWMLMVWIIIINCVGIILCIEKLYAAKPMAVISHSMKHYRSVPKYKHFMDNLQWSLKCCGLDSYKDWFNQDWYERTRDYEWDPSRNKLGREDKTDITISDSVPLSCCKSGTCVPNYLLELGTHSIHTKGCNKSLSRIYKVLMNAHLIMFASIFITEILLLTCIVQSTKNNVNACTCACTKHGHSEYTSVKHLMSVNNRFGECSSTDSCPGYYRDSEEDDEINQREGGVQPVSH